MNLLRLSVPFATAMQTRRTLLAAMAWTPMLPWLSGCAQVDTEAGATSDSDKPTNTIFLEDEKAVLPQGDTLRLLVAPGLELTKLSEGWVSHLYNDAAGYCTVGYGHLCYKNRCDGRTPESYLAGITEPAGSTLLRTDMQKAQVALQSALPGHRDLLNDFQYAALCDFVYNAGGANFMASTLRKAVLARQFDRVPAQLRRWVLAGGKPFKGLQLRREREITLFFRDQVILRSVPRVEDDLSPLDIAPPRSVG